MKEVDRRHAYCLITAWSFLRRRRTDPNRDPKAEMMGEEYVRVAWMLLVLSDQQVNALLRDVCRGRDVVTEL